MPAITIDQRSALVLIDLQKGILALPTLLSQDDIKNRARRLAAAFRATALPVVRVKVAFSADGGDLPPGRALVPGPKSAPPAAYSEFPDDFPPHPGDIILVKRHWGVHRNRAGPPAPPPRRDPDRSGRHLHQHRGGIHSAQRLGKQLQPDLRRRCHHRRRRRVPHARLHQDLPPPRRDRHHSTDHRHP